MNRLSLSVLSIIAICLGLVSTSLADPQQDLAAYQQYFKKKFPTLSPVDLSNGMYNFNDDKRAQWESIMEFPPYEIAVDKGEALFNKPFKNGKTYASCFEKGGIGIAHTYPRFDTKRGKVVTLAASLNECRKAGGEEPLTYLKGDMAAILAYMAHTSRGKPISVKVPNNKAALAAYKDGKRIYFTRRGPRAFACYHCHWEAAGQKIRGNELSPAVGQVSHFPSYRSKWGGMGTIQRRYKGCMKNIGAKPLKEQTEAMNNLEYFHTFLSNGIPMNAPGTRF
ncbi:MAG: sulfur oxidation c-type cytochrome SoxA [Gammaproteobacteria bacterium]|nr:sulfur oxidation c-type cytochrome SoxA [Gammaproteobacteria bacterium]